MTSLIKNDLEADPLLQLGYGIVLYRDALLLYTYFFFILSILFMPVMFAYKSGEGFVVKPTTGNEVWSLGNLGQSSTICKNGPFDVATLTLSCQYGILGNLTQFGINYGENEKSNCIIQEENTCNEYIDSDYVQSQYDQCILSGDTECFIDFSEDALFLDYASTPEICYDEYDYFFMQYQCV